MATTSKSIGKYTQMQKAMCLKRTLISFASWRQFKVEIAWGADENEKISKYKVINSLLYCLGFLMRWVSLSSWCETKKTKKISYLWNWKLNCSLSTVTESRRKRDEQKSFRVCRFVMTCRTVFQVRLSLNASPLFSSVFENSRKLWDLNRAPSFILWKGINHFVLRWNKCWKKLSSLVVLSRSISFVSYMLPIKLSKDIK